MIGEEKFSGIQAKNFLVLKYIYNANQIEMYIDLDVTEYQFKTSLK